MLTAAGFAARSLTQRHAASFVTNFSTSPPQSFTFHFVSLLLRAVGADISSHYWFSLCWSVIFFIISMSSQLGLHYHLRLWPRFAGNLELNAVLPAYQRLFA